MKLSTDQERETGDGGPGIGEIGGGEFEVAEVAGEHDGDEGDEVEGGVGENHGQGEDHLLLGLRNIDHLVEKPLLPRKVSSLQKRSRRCLGAGRS